MSVIDLAVLCQWAYGDNHFRTKISVQISEKLKREIPKKIGQDFIIRSCDIYTFFGGVKSVSSIPFKKLITILIAKLTVDKHSLITSSGLLLITRQQSGYASINELMVC